jgi:outer membrane protein assembly factor BamB
MEPLGPDDPERIGRYECLGRLGAGGMGQVYLGRADDGGLVALKLIHSDLAADPAFRTRFTREAEALRRVGGPYTAPLVDTGDVPRPWLATPYLPGLSLDEAVARHGVLSIDATRRLGAALTEALAAIHEAGVVHRDLKPGNILLTAGGPRVVDFGIAVDRSLGTVDEATGTALGTPAYMAPEQLTGARAGFPADVFALGGILVFCRTGAPPVRTMRSEPPDRCAPARPAADLPDSIGDESLRAVIEACLAEDPARRPGVRELAAALSPSATGTAWLPRPMAVDITDRDTAAPGPTHIRPRTAGHGRRRVLLRISGMAGAALAGVVAVRAVAGAEPAAAPVRWTADATVVSGDEFGPESGGRLFFLDRTVVTSAGKGRLDLCCLDAATGRYVWRRALTPFERRNGGVVAALGGVWVRSREELCAVDPVTGAVRWSHRRPFPGLVPAVACGDALVYDVAPTTAPAEGGIVYAHEPRLGRVRWQRSLTGTPVGTVVVAGGVVYVISASAREQWGRVNALDSATGSVRWISSYSESVLRTPSLAPRYADATLCVSGDTVYVSVEGRLVQALDTGTGAVRWRTRPRLANDEVMPEPYPTAAFPVVVGDNLLLGTGDGVMRAFGKRDGRPRWAAATGASPVAVGRSRRCFTPLAGHGLVFVRGADTVRALGAEDGRARWEIRTDPSAGGPVLAGGVLHVPGRGEMTSHDPASGRILQRLDLCGRLPAAVVAGRNAVHVLVGVDTVVAAGLPG